MDEIKKITERIEELELENDDLKAALKASQDIVNDLTSLVEEVLRFGKEMETVAGNIVKACERVN